MADWLTSARSKHKRRARNYVSDVAQKRLEEVLPAFRDQIQNALLVDSVGIVVFKQTRIGLPCSCGKHLVTTDDELDNNSVDEDGNDNGELVVEAHTTGSNNNRSGGKVKFDVGSGDIFGEGVYDRKIDDLGSLREVELSEVKNPLPASAPEGSVVELDHDTFQDTELVGNSDVCGICYKYGFQPPFELVGYSYSLLTHYNITRTYGYFEDKSTKPLEFNKQAADGYMEFELQVPKYFVTASYSIRCNESILSGRYPLFDNQNNPLTKTALEAARGKTIRVRVKEVERFSHVVVLFKLLEKDVVANIPEEQDMLNYENETTIGDLTVVLPQSVGSIRSGDLIVIPKRNLVLKVNSAPRRTTADKQLWEWNVTARAVQRSEMFFNIFKSFKIW